MFLLWIIVGCVAVLFGVLEVRSWKKPRSPRLGESALDQIAGTTGSGRPILDYDSPDTYREPPS